MIELLLTREGKESNDAQQVINMMEAINLSFSGKENLNAKHALEDLLRRAT